MGTRPYRRDGSHNLLPPHDPRRRDGLTQFMHLETTVEQLRRKLSTISETYGMALAPYDVDRFLALGPYYFYDAALDGPPTVESVETLVKLGVPRWPLTNKGTVAEVFAILDARRSKGLASVPQARLLRDKGHPRPWAVLFTEVGSELYRLRREKERKNGP
jgi:hypothetical protein